MALGCPTTGDGAIRTTNLIAASSDYSCVVTFRAATAPVGVRTVWAMRNAGDTAYVRIVSVVNTNTFRLEVNAGGGQSQTTTATLEADIRGSVGYTRNGTTHTFYCNGVSVGSVTLDVSAVTFANAVLGDDGASVGGLELQYFREWPSVLTLAQLLAEWNSPTDLIAADTDTPLVSDYLDASGNGHTWAAVGTPDFVDGPLPLPLTNIASGTAYTIPALPAFYYQVAHQAGTTRDLWYSYTTVNESVLNFFGVGGITGPYDPSTVIYTADFNDQLGVTNRAGQVGVTPATQYYFRIDASPIVHPAAAATLSVVGFTNTGTIPAGSIFVPSDNVTGIFTDVPSSFIDSTTGEFLAFNTNFPAGEQGDNLTTGQMLLEDENEGDLKLYDGAFNLIAAVPFTGVGVVVRANRTAGTFYAGNPNAGVGNAIVVVVNPDTGSMPATWTLDQAGLTAIATNNAETILYYAGDAVLDIDSSVKRWDLVNDLPLTAFVPTVVNHRVRDILVLTDDTLLIEYEGIFPTPGAYVTHYNPAGTLLHTYVISTFAQGDIPRLAYALDDPLSFWAWVHDEETTDTTTAHFYNIRVSDGAILTDIEYPEYHHGIAITGEVPEPSEPRPGVQSSCPFLITTEGDEPGTGEIVVIKTTVPADDTTSFPITLTGDGDPVTVTLTSGESHTFTNIPEGDGYTITETVDSASWTTTYEVSNGSPIDDLEVADGETVTVTITNTGALETDPIRWLRRAPVMSDENIRLFHSQFTLDLQAGTGLVSGQGADPR